MPKDNPKRKQLITEGSHVPTDDCTKNKKKTKSQKEENESADHKTSSLTNILVKKWKDDKRNSKKNKSTQERVILRCPRKDCTYQTSQNGLVMKTARTHLLKNHMSKDILCKELIESCACCKNFFYIKETEFNLFSSHLTRGGCKTFKFIEPVIESQALTISNETSFSRNALLKRYKHVPKNSMNNMLVDDGLSMLDSSDDQLLCQPTNKDNEDTKPPASVRKPTSREILQFITNENRNDLSFSIQDPAIEDYISKCFHTDRSKEVDEIIPFPIADTNSNYDSDTSSTSNHDSHQFADADSSERNTSNEDNRREIRNALPLFRTTNSDSASSVQIESGTETQSPTFGVEQQEEASANNGSNIASLPSIQETAMYLLQHRYGQKNELFSKQEIAYIGLLKILDRPDIPLCVFDEVAKWVRDNHSSIKTADIITRNGLTKIIQENLHGKMKDRLKPIIIPTELPSGTKLGVPVMDFEYMLANMLINDELMCQENLLIDLNDPVKKRINTSGEYGDIDTGSWYSETYDKRCTNRQVDVLLPLIKFIDSTVIDKLGKQSLEPVAATLGIFNRATRYQP